MNLDSDPSLPRSTNAAWSPPGGGAVRCGRCGALFRLVLTCAGILAATRAGHAADEPPRAVVMQQDDGFVNLSAADALIDGPNARLDGGDKKILIWWTSSDTSVHWTAGLQKPGKYRVELDYCLLGNNNGSKLEFVVGDQTVTAIPKAGKGLNDYKVGQAGIVTIKEAGNVPVIVRSAVKGHEFVINVRSVTLVPAETSSRAIDVSGGAIKQSEDGSFQLAAADAEINGSNAELETRYDVPNIGFWKDVDTSLAWAIDVRKTGRYRVELCYSLTPSSVGSKIAVAVGDQVIKAKPTAGKNWMDYKTGKAGEIELSRTGEAQVVLTPFSKAQDFIVNLRSVALIPVEKPAPAPDISDKPTRQAADGSVKLLAANAAIDGQVAKLEGGESKFIVWWGSANAFVGWPVKVDKPGNYLVQLTYALRDSDGGSDIKMSLGEQSVAGKLKPSGGLDSYKTETIGEIKLDKSENVEAMLTSSKDPGSLVMHLRAVTFVPVRKK